MPCHHEILFDFEKLPAAQDHFLHPYQGIFKKTFILTIPQGQVFGLDGWVLFHDRLVDALIWQNVLLHKNSWQEAQNHAPLVHVNGRVAVIAQSGYTYYYHWLVEVLGRLALLEMYHVDYDFLYVPVSKPYMKETLELWGIDPAKIIAACDDTIIQADELIIPSLVAHVEVSGIPRLVHYIPKYIVTYIKNKLMNSKRLPSNSFNFSKKVFISRKDATARRMINED
jgi:capsular polysaccharide biosynthesis protein